jgi:hypothetical protein
MYIENEETILPTTKIKESAINKSLINRNILRPYLPVMDDRNNRKPVPTRAVVGNVLKRIYDNVPAFRSEFKRSAGVGEYNATYSTPQGKFSPIVIPCARLVFLEDRQLDENFVKENRMRFFRLYKECAEKFPIFVEEYSGGETAEFWKTIKEEIKESNAMIQTELDFGYSNIDKFKSKFIQAWIDFAEIKPTALPFTLLTLKSAEP